MRRALSVLLTLTVVVGTLPVPAAAAEDPRFEVYVPEPRIQPGATQTVTIHLVNDAKEVDERVRAANNVKVIPRSGKTPFDILSGTQLVGRIPDGVPTPVTFRIEVPGDVAPGSYEIPLKITYEYEGDERKTTRVKATVRVPKRPRFRIVNTSSTLFLGERGTVTVKARNVGSAVARETTLTLTSQNPALNFAGAPSTATFVGNWSPGTVKTVTFPVQVASSAMPREYALTLKPTYENEEGHTTAADPMPLGITPDAGHRIAVVDAETSVPIGETGTLSVTLVNRGETVLEDASITLETGGQALSFQGTSATSAFIGQWAPGEQRTVTVNVSAAPSADIRSHLVEARVAYAFPEGTSAMTGPLSFGVTPAPEQTVAFRDFSVNLHGSIGTVTGVVVNTGDRPIHDALVTLQSVAPSVRVTEGTTPVGTLDPGESAPISAEIRVMPNTSPGIRELRGTVGYERGGRSYRTDPSSFQVPIRTGAELFAVESMNATFGVDTTNTFRVRLRNTADIPLTDIHVTLRALPPYQSQTPTAYVRALEPGESAVLTFEVTTPEDAVPSTGAMPLNVTAETPKDKRIAAGPYFAPFTIAEAGAAAQDVTVLAVGAVVVLVLLGAGWWWLNR